MKTNKNMTNTQIAELLRSVAAALELSSGDNHFRIVAYQRAADAIEHATSEAKDLWDNGQLQELAGVGPSIASYLDELFKTGKVRHFNAILKPYPPALFALMEVSGIGPKTAYRLTKALGISRAHSAVSVLEKAARGAQIRSLEGFGVDSEAEILKNITDFKNRSHRQLLPAALSVADSVVTWLRKSSYVRQTDALGSLRRRTSTIGDIDIAVATDHPAEVIGHFTDYPKSARTLEAGDHSASILLKNGLQIDLKVQPVSSYGSLLQHFTGSKFHNIALREYAQKMGLSLSEYGIKVTDSGLFASADHILKHSAGDYDSSLKQYRFSDELSFYNFLGLEWIPPELREDSGEIDAAMNRRLPELVELDRIKGDLQVHSDIDVQPSHDLGLSSLSEIAYQAQKLGYQYIGLTEHNPSLSNHTDLQKIDIIKRKTHIIEQYNQRVKTESENNFYFFNGLEIDILPDGTRALPDSALELLDYACVSIHTSFDLSRKNMTDRVIKALDHPKVRFLAHPTGRLLNQREGVELDWDVIFDYCLRHHKWLEIDGWPNRLDLPDDTAREAVRAGIKLVVDTDSHKAEDLIYMVHGVSVARRAWATPTDIINTQDLNSISRILKEVKI